MDGAALGAHAGFGEAVQVGVDASWQRDSVFALRSAAPAVQTLRFRSYTWTVRGCWDDPASFLANLHPLHPPSPVLR